MKLLLPILLVFYFVAASAQQYESEQSTITFFSEAAIEDIAAINTEGTSRFNSNTGSIEFLVQMNGFEFEKSLMQQHYNEKYLETAEYPTASFVGEVIGFENALEGKPEVRAKGKLSIHGQTKQVDTKGSLTIVNEKIVIASSFTIRLEDYKIEIPKLLWKSVTESVEVKIEFTYIPVK